MSKEVTRSLTRSGRGCFELLSGDCLELRRRLMQSWVDSLSGTQASLGEHTFTYANFFYRRVHGNRIFR